MKYPMSFEQISADIHALVAGDASQRLEQSISGELLRRECRRVAGEPAVELAAGRDQRSFEDRDGIQDTWGIRPVPIRLPELTDEHRIAAQLSDHFLDSAIHDPRVLQRGCRLCLQRAKFSFPSEAETERGVEYRGSIERKLGPIWCCVLRISARSIGLQVVAAQARARVTVRQSRICEEAFTESQFQRVRR